MSHFLTANPCEQIHTHLLCGPACSNLILGFGKSHFLIINYEYIHINMAPDTCAAFPFWCSARNITRNSRATYKQKSIPALVKPTAMYQGSDKSLARPGRKQATVTKF